MLRRDGDFFLFGTAMAESYSFWAEASRPHNSKQAREVADIAPSFQAAKLAELVAVFQGLKNRKRA